MKKKKSAIFLKISLVLCLVLSIFVGGFFFLDKLIVPKYFGEYGIYNISDLIGVMTSLYSSPNEEELVSNGHTQVDLDNAISSLQKAGYKIEDNGSILSENYDNFKGDGRVKLTDREVAAVCQALIKNGMLNSALPDLKYLNVDNISILELIISPIKESQIAGTETYTRANIEFIVKIDTSAIRTQIAEQMETPMYLLKFIIPDKLYFSVEYSINLDAESNERTSGKISINGKTAKQSETLIMLLIKFIFPAEEHMDIDGFTRAIGDVAFLGIDSLGEFKFTSGIYEENPNNSNGVVFN